MKTIKFLLLSLFATSLLSSCLKDNDIADDYPHAILFMVNAYTPTPAVAFAADDNYLQSPNAPLQYNKFTYSRLFPGNRKIRAFTATNTIIDTAYTFKDSTLYTSFIYHSQDPSILIVEDKLLTLNSNAGIRFLHLAGNVGAVDVFLESTENKIISARAIEKSGQAFQSGNYIFVAEESGKQNIIIKNTEGETLVEREFDFAAGRYYSIILSGDKNSTATPLYLGVVTQY